MTAVAERSLGLLSSPQVSDVPAISARLPRGTLIPVAVAAINATAFFVLRPGVNDLWAARARASAASHGVGPTYWFSWFSGGSTPGNYSVLTPYLSALISAELVGALAAMAIAILTAFAVRGTAHPVAAVGVATFAAGVNLWSGRVPFLLGSAIAIAVLLAVRHQRPMIAGLLTLMAVLASPVSAAFLALALVGICIASPRYRRISASTIVSTAVGFALVALAFGTPGPQHFSWALCGEALGALVLFMFARPPDHLRVVLWLSMATALAVATIPNGMGSNFGRMIWFCLPVFVVATTRRPVWIALLLVCPVLLAGASLTVTDLRDASAPVAATAYYQPLGQELDGIPGLTNYRLEVVAEGAHAAYDALLNHAMLARGWETQEDNALNPILLSRSLNATAYKVWLDNNSVGYVALPRATSQTFPEYTMVAARRLAYLHEIWSSRDWALFRVDTPTPIVAAPQSVLSYSQSTLRIRSACRCTFSVRIRFSRYLRADLVTGHRTAATVVSDGFGYTRVSTPEPGDYSVYGSVSELFH